MALMFTPEVVRGWKAVDFALPGTDGKTYSLKDARGPKGLVVMFIANHCPYVQVALDKIVRDMAELKLFGIGSIAIAPNDIATYPQDGMEPMKKLAEQKHFPFPYVLDETQEVAKAYGAVCTPDFFGFNSSLELQYRGRLDDSAREFTHNRPRDLFEAMKRIAETGKGPEIQNPSQGCSVKWRS